MWPVQMPKKKKKGICSRISPSAKFKNVKKKKKKKDSKTSKKRRKRSRLFWYK